MRKKSTTATFDEDMPITRGDIDAGEQQRPGIAGGAAVGRFGGGWIGRCCRRCGRRCSRRGQREGGERSAQGPGFGGS